MATLAAHACLDLVAGAPLPEVMAALNDGLDGRRVDVHASTSPDGGHRLHLFADRGTDWFESHLQRVAERAGGHLSRALLAVNRDTYCVEHVVFAVHGGGLRRVHRVFIRPEGRRMPEVWQIAGLDGFEARRRAARLFGVPVANMEYAARLDERAHAYLGELFTPNAHWWDALGVGWPDPGSERWTVLDGSP